MSEIPGPGLGGLLIKAHIATHPLLGMAALTFAAMGRVRYAIIALGIIVIMTWLNTMPSVVLHGLDFKGVLSTLHMVVQIVAFPLIGVCAIAYAAHNENLGRATLLVAIPTLFGVFGVLAFTIGVSIYGFDLPSISPRKRAEIDGYI
jgi:signal transduction histidine kinase